MYYYYNKAFIKTFHRQMGYTHRNLQNEIHEAELEFGNYVRSDYRLENLPSLVYCRCVPQSFSHP